MQDSVLLSVKNLVKAYGAHKAVNDISFNIHKGTIFGLLGPNGAGKSTLLRMITGIFHQDTGEILMEGKPFDGLKHTDFIGYMPEERGLYKKMKVGEHILYLAKLKGLDGKEANERAKYWVDRLHMGSWWNKKVEDLSKGMGQKLQFVATVIHNPKLLILDEPFSGLDPVNANVIKEEIFRLAKEGTTIIFSTHRMEQVEEICDQIILVNLGSKILDGTVSGVKQQFKDHLFSIATAEPIGELPDNIEILEKETHLVKFKAEAIETPNRVLKHLIDQNIHIQSFQEHLPSLNDIFIKLVGTSSTARPFVEQ